MLGSLTGLGRLGYELLYVVPAAFVFILGIDTSLAIPGVVTLTSIHAIALVVLSIYGAVWMHHAGLLIFGDDHGIASTKLSKVSNKHMIYFLTNVEPNDLPDTSSSIELIMAAVLDNEMSWRVFVRGFPGALYVFYGYIAWVWLAVYLLGGGTSIIGGIIWLVLSVLIFGNRVRSYLPDFVPIGSVDRIDTPEYVLNHKAVADVINDDESRPRIEPRSASANRPRIRSTKR